jgi:hypothetical protein
MTKRRRHVAGTEARKYQLCCAVGAAPQILGGDTVILCHTSYSSSMLQGHCNLTLTLNHESCPFGNGSFSVEGWG